MSQLGFDFGAGQPQELPRITPARLATFVDCPRRYRMTYLDRPQPPRTGAWAHNTLGGAVHNALRALFELRPRRRTPARAAALLTEHWQDAGFADAEQAAHYRARARAWLADYVEHVDVGTEPVALERWVSARVNAQTGGRAHPSVIVEGRADRIDERDGQLVVVDYKTGRQASDEQDARRSQALAIYAVAAARTLRAPCHRVELHHVPTRTVGAAEHSDESLRGHVERAGQIAQQVRTAADKLAEGGDGQTLFPVRVGQRCSWCECRPSCPEGQRAAPAARSWDLLRPE